MHARDNQGDKQCCSAWKTAGTPSCSDKQQRPSVGVKGVIEIVHMAATKCPVDLFSWFSSWRVPHRFQFTSQHMVQGCLSLSVGSVHTGTVLKKRLASKRANSRRGAHQRCDSEAAAGKVDVPRVQRHQVVKNGVVALKRRPMDRKIAV